jgi:hypothetical protein
MSLRWSRDELKTMFLLRAGGASYEHIGKVLGSTGPLVGAAYRKAFLRDFRPATPTGRRCVRLSRIQRPDGVTLRYENV